MSDALTRKLSGYASLSPEEQAALRAAPSQVRRVGAREDIIHEGARTGGVNLVLEGFAARYKMLEDGRRQLLSYFVPGDFCDLRVFVLERMDHSIMTIAPSLMASISKEAVNDITERFPRLTRALWWSTLVEEATTREWLMNIGQRTAYERAAHLFCEICWRLRAVDLSRQTGPDSCVFDFPVTQLELGDTLGLSAVHMNRILQELRRDGLITLKSGILAILNLDTLSRVAMFDPAYLHLRDRDHGSESAPAHEHALATARA